MWDLAFKDLSKWSFECCVTRLNILHDRRHLLNVFKDTKFYEEKCWSRRTAINTKFARIESKCHLPRKRNKNCVKNWSQEPEVYVKAHSHYCVFRVHLRQTVVLLRRDRKIPISALTQSTAESADRCGECESALRQATDLAVWPDLAKNYHFGIIFEVIGKKNVLRVYLVFGKIFNLFGEFEGFKWRNIKQKI